eukprot:Opistho-2@56095
MARYHRLGDPVLADTSCSLNADEEEHYAIVARGLCRNYGKTRILEGLDMAVPKGKIYSLLGPSGCGKTTLLKCLMGRLSVHGGRLTVLGNTPGARATMSRVPMLATCRRKRRCFSNLLSVRRSSSSAVCIAWTQKTLTVASSFLLNFLSFRRRTASCVR